MVNLFLRSVAVGIVFTLVYFFRDPSVDLHPQATTFRAYSVNIGTPT